MTSLQETKDQVAQEHALCNWEDLGHYTRQYLTDDVARRYAKSAIEADRKDCAEKVTVTIIGSCDDFWVDESSILDRPYPTLK